MQAIGKMELQLIKSKADIENPAKVAIVREVPVWSTVTWSKLMLEKIKTDIAISHIR